MESLSSNSFFLIEKVPVSKTTPEHARKSVLELVQQKKGGYITIGNMRTTVIANHDPAYLDVVKNAQMNWPDGMPLVWCARAWGLKDVQRTVGPDAFVSLLSDSKNGLKHFLIGDTEETLSALINKYKTEFNTCFAGYISPPFVDWPDFDYEGIAEQVKKSGANIVWVSMRAPKQDFFNKRLSGLLPGVLCIGVGAGFRFALGKYKQPPALWKKMGLTGFFWMREGILYNVFWYIKHLFYLLSFLIRITYKKNVLYRFQTRNY